MKIEQVCECCFKSKASSITHNQENDKWYFCCDKCLPFGYDIPFDRLGENDWLRHMQAKGWVDMNSFLPRFMWASKGFKNLDIKK